MSIVKVTDIAFVRFSAPDLNLMRSFLEDFGLRCHEENGKLYARGRDGSPYIHVTELGEPRFASLAFRVKSRDDLEKLAQHDHSAVVPVDAPGGGFRVALRDPDGIAVDVVAEQSWSITEPPPPDSVINSASQRRRLREPVRFAPGPSHVFRLGHAVLNVSDFLRSEAWYKKRFGFITSDQIEAKPGTACGAFLRCDRGATPTDHHTLFLLQGSAPPGFNHAAFEVTSLNDLMKGHTFLRSQDRDHAWGIGRHILGSQIFDYWNDPWGNKLEHWTDGDLFTSVDPAGVASLADLQGTLWGPKYPAAPEPH